MPASLLPLLKLASIHRPALMARASSASDGRALDTRPLAPPGRASWCGRARPAHSARHALAARGETAYGDPVHHHLSPSRGAPEHPTPQASPGTARGVFDIALPRARGMPGVVAHPVPSPEEDTSGSRARHGLGD